MPYARMVGQDHCLSGPSALYYYYYYYYYCRCYWPCHCPFPPVTPLGPTAIPTAQVSSLTAALFLLLMMFPG